MTVTTEKAQMGVLITLQEPTKEMRKAAATGEFYLSEWGQHPKIQLLTVKDLLAGKGINRPPDRSADRGDVQESAKGRSRAGPTGAVRV